MSCFVVKSSEKQPILQFEGTSYCGVRRFRLVLALSRVVSFFLGFKNQSPDWKHPLRPRERPLVIIPLAPLGFFCSASSSVGLEGSFGLVSSPTQWVELIEWWNLTSFECVLDMRHWELIWSKLRFYFMSGITLDIVVFFLWRTSYWSIEDKTYKKVERNPF